MPAITWWHTLLGRKRPALEPATGICTPSQRAYKLIPSPPDARDVVFDVAKATPGPLHGALRAAAEAFAAIPTHVVPAPAKALAVIKPAPLPPAGAAAPPSPPVSVDMRAFMPPVLDQGTLGSCASNATSNVLRLLLSKELLRVFQPSRLFLYYNTRVRVEGSPADEDTGVCIRDVFKAIAQYHVCDEVDWPYVVSRFSAAPSAVAVANAATHLKIQYSSVPQVLASMKAVLALGHPIVVGIQVYESFESDAVANTGIVPTPVPGGAEQCLGGHAVVVCGYCDATGRFLVQNSWGTAWGLKGYFWLDYKYLTNPLLAGDFWIASTFV